uniref:GDP-fucose protein O-fucosyltransferase 1 n=1 Tax=Arion vulgaris TaxID=1028688 RepID=A0A0B7A674_9EUPU
MLINRDFLFYFQKRNTMREATDYLFPAVFLAVLHFSAAEESSSHVSVDPNGYVAYCPCMGRFGNQADQFLGALAFAKALNRTLVLPPWVEYRRGSRSAVMEPYDSYFLVEPLREYHRVITMESFMTEIAPTVWPPGQRKVFCYSARHGSNKDHCNAKEGNPFGPFWDWFHIDFDESVIFGPLFYDIQMTTAVAEWTETYPSKDYPVLAFVGPPAAFPVSQYHIKLQRYVKWSHNYSKLADEFIQQNIPHRPFLGIHLRNGPDFEKACEHVSTTPNMFAAKQCIGERGEFGPTTQEMCFPSISTVTEQVKKEVNRLGIKTVFIATDYNDLRTELSKVLSNISLVKQAKPASPMLDLVILGRSDHFIGNCVSTFTAFVKRERDVTQLPSSFWAFEKQTKKQEL